MQGGLRRDLLPSPEGIVFSSTQGYVVHTLVCLAPTKLHLWSSVAESQSPPRCSVPANFPSKDEVGGSERPQQHLPWGVRLQRDLYMCVRHQGPQEKEWMQRFVLDFAS